MKTSSGTYSLPLYRFPTAWLQWFAHASKNHALPHRFSQGWVWLVLPGLLAGIAGCVLLGLLSESGDSKSEEYWFISQALQKTNVFFWLSVVFLGLLAYVLRRLISPFGNFFYVTPELLLEIRNHHVKVYPLA